MDPHCCTVYGDNVCALDIATLCLSCLLTSYSITVSRQEHMMKEMKDMMLQQNEITVQQQIARADVETQEIARTVQQIAGTDPEPEERALTVQETQVTNSTAESEQSRTDKN
jgi:hypothetical protein